MVINGKFYCITATYSNHICVPRLAMFQLKSIPKAPKEFFFGIWAGGFTKSKDETVSPGPARFCLKIGYL